MSTSSVRRSAAARDAARFTAVVVFPTPPFWFAIVMMRGMVSSRRAEVPRLEHRRKRTGGAKRAARSTGAGTFTRRSSEAAGHSWPDGTLHAHSDTHGGSRRIAVRLVPD